MRSLYGAYGVLAGGTGSGYKYLTKDWYNDDAGSGGIRTINTEDLDLDRGGGGGGGSDGQQRRKHAVPGAIRRDTAADLGDRGQQVVRIVTARTTASRWVSDWR